MLDEKDLKALDELLAQRLGVVLESEIMPKFQILAEGQKAILDTLTPKSKIEELEEEIALLKSVIRLHSEQLAELKKAQ